MKPKEISRSQLEANLKKYTSDIGKFEAQIAEVQKALLKYGTGIPIVMTEACHIYVHSLKQQIDRSKSLIRKGVLYAKNKGWEMCEIPKYAELFKL